jgi:hypothetical protein
VLRQFLFFWRELKVFGGEHIEVDTTKPRAVKSFDRSFTGKAASVEKDTDSKEERQRKICALADRLLYPELRRLFS